MTSLVALFALVWILVAAVVGNIADAAGVRQQHAEQGWRPVQATLLESAAQAAAASPVWGAAWVQARWPVSGGHERTGPVATELNARAGQRVGIWITRAGNPTRPPLTRSGVIDQVVFAVLSATMALAVLLAMSAGAVRMLFNRRRIAGWQRAWEAVGPIWSRR